MEYIPADNALEPMVLAASLYYRLFQLAPLVIEARQKKLARLLGQGCNFFFRLQGFVPGNRISFFDVFLKMVLADAVAVIMVFCLARINGPLAIRPAFKPMQETIRMPANHNHILA